MNVSCRRETVKYPLITMITLSSLAGCAGSPEIDDSWMNQTGMVACKYADRAYGEGTVQARQQARDGAVDCVKQLEK
jgi:hypothetical protein